MRTILFLCLAGLIAVSFGCSKKKAEAPKTPVAEKPDMSGKVVYMFDPVSKEEIDPGKSQYIFEYKGVVYGFASAENMAAFKADPDKYVAALPPAGRKLPTPEAGQKQ